MIWLQPNTNINMANTAWVIGAIVTGIEPVMKIAMENEIPIQYKLTFILCSTDLCVFQPSVRQLLALFSSSLSCSAIIVKIKKLKKAKRCSRSVNIPISGQYPPVRESVGSCGTPRTYTTPSEFSK